LTAAHCLKNSTKTLVILGAHKLKSGSKDKQLQLTVHPNNYRIHAGYDPSNDTNDIALLFLPELVKSTKNITHVSLPFKFQKEQFRGYLGSMIGWSERFSDDYSPALRYATNRIITNSECEIIRKERFNGTMICNAVTDRKSKCLGKQRMEFLIK
jgi:hypothetical protein